MLTRQTNRVRTLTCWAVGSAMLLCATAQAGTKAIKRNLSSKSVGAAKIKPACIRYAGQGHWTLAMLMAKVRKFYVGEFGQQPRVTALGQSLTHNQLGFDHRHALDIGVHPDSQEGQALMDFLRAQKIPFIAIRKAIPGSATAPHIHIGRPSNRILNTNASR